LKNEFITRPYEKGDEKEIVDILNQGFGKWPNFSISCSSLEHWIWKYLENPFHKHYIVVSEANGKIVGANHAYPIKVYMNNENILAAFGSDVAVNPEFRRKGIRTRMLEMKVELRRRDNIKMTLSVTSNPIIIQSYARSPTHRKFPHKVSNLVRIKNIDLQLKKIPVKNPTLIKAGFYTLRLINDMRKSFEQKPQGSTVFKIREISSFDERINVFWKHLSKKYGFIIERKMDYLNWRYCHRFAGDFIVKIAEGEDERILGYYVAKINKNLENYPIGYLVDLLALPEYPEIVDKLIEDSLKHFDEKKVNIVNCLCVENHPFSKNLKRHGFLDSQFDLQLFINEHSKIDELDWLVQQPKEKMHFSYGDIDSLPINIPKY
jgi:GNAT superfamily N-acetyltransferase